MDKSYFIRKTELISKEELIENINGMKETVEILLANSIRIDDVIMLKGEIFMVNAILDIIEGMEVEAVKMERIEKND